MAVAQCMLDNKSNVFRKDWVYENIFSPDQYNKEKESMVEDAMNFRISNLKMKEMTHQNQVYLMVPLMI